MHGCLAPPTSRRHLNASPDRQQASPKTGGGTQYEMQHETGKSRQRLPHWHLSGGTLVETQEEEHMSAEPAGNAGEACMAA